MISSTRRPSSSSVAELAPLTIANSPYQFKVADPYSSHCVILRLAGQGNGRRLLDVGAAHGYLAAALRSHDFRVTGIEADPVLGEEAAKHCDEFLLLDLDGSLPRFREPFDVIVFGDVLEHLKDPSSVLLEFAGALVSDGVVIVSLPNIANIYVRLNLLFGCFDYQDRGLLDRTHLHFFTRKTFRSFLSSAGLEIARLDVTPIPLPMLLAPSHRGSAPVRALHALNAWLARAWPTMFGYQFVALARKASAPRS